MKYLQAMIEMDSNNLYKKGVVITECGNNIEVLVIENSKNMIEELWKFAMQENISFVHLIRDRKKVVFQKLGKKVIPGVTCQYNYNNDKKIDRFYKKISEITKKVISLGSLGNLKVGRIKYFANYRLRKNDSYDKTLGFQIKANDKIINPSMQNIIDKNWQHVNIDDLDLVYKSLDEIISTNIGIVNNYFKNDECTSFDNLINIKEKFINNSLDYIAISSFDNFIIEMCRYFYDKKNKLAKDDFKFYEDLILKFLVIDNFEISVDRFGNKIYYNINNISPLARYVILKIIKGLIETLEFTYEIYPKSKVISILHEKIEDTKLMIKNNVKCNEKSK